MKEDWETFREIKARNEVISNSVQAKGTYGGQKTTTLYIRGTSNRTIRNEIEETLMKSVDYKEWERDHLQISDP